MDPCVYATQHGTWLRAVLVRSPTEVVCFRSAKRWAAVRRLLKRQTVLPVFFRQQDDATSVLACRFVGDLAEVCFADEFEDDERRLAWLHDRLSLQRETIKSQPRLDRFPTWESQYQTWEIDNFMKALTWFSVCRLREIEPLPLPTLIKLADNRPLSPKFVRGYAICRYPHGEVKTITGPAA